MINTIREHDQHDQIHFSCHLQTPNKLLLLARGLLIVHYQEDQRTGSPWIHAYSIENCAYAYFMARALFIFAIRQCGDSPRPRRGMSASNVQSHHFRFDEGSVESGWNKVGAGFDSNRSRVRNIHANDACGPSKTCLKMGSSFATLDPTRTFCQDASLLSDGPRNTCNLNTVSLSLVCSGWHTEFLPLCTNTHASQPQN
jgi:hypothetical protein